MIIVDADTVDSESTVMIILNTALIANAAMVHTWKLENVTFLTKFKTSLVFILSVNKLSGYEIILIQNSINLWFKSRNEVIRISFALLQYFLKLSKLKRLFRTITFSYFIVNSFLLHIIQSSRIGECYVSIDGNFIDSNEPK